MFFSTDDVVRTERGTRVRMGKVIYSHPMHIVCYGNRPVCFFGPSGLVADTTFLFVVPATERVIRDSFTLERKIDKELGRKFALERLENKYNDDDDDCEGDYLKWALPKKIADYILCSSLPLFVTQPLEVPAYFIVAYVGV